MPTLDAAPLSTRLPLPDARWAVAAVAVVWLTVVAHGCHGADADHEPAAAPPLTECRTP